MFKKTRLLLVFLLALSLILFNSGTASVLAQGPDNPPSEGVQGQQEGDVTPEPTGTDEETGEPTEPPAEEPTPTETPTETPTDTTEEEPTPTDTPTDTTEEEPTPTDTPTPTDEPAPTETPLPEAPPAETPPVDETPEDVEVEPTPTELPTVAPSEEITATATVEVVVEASTAEGVSANLYSGSWQSGIGIKNLETTPNQVTVEFFNANTGALQSYSYSNTLGNLQGVELYLPNIPGLPAGSFASRVSAQGAVGVSTTSTNYAANMADSYNGMPGATQFFIPGIYNNHNSWVSEVLVQNTTGSAINARMEVRGINLVTQAPVGPVTFGPLSIPANATRSFDTSTNSPFNFDGSLGTSFLGSARIYNDQNQPMAVVLFNTRVAGSSQVVLSYRGMTTATDASVFLAAPVIYKNFNNGWRSGINVQNVGGSTVAATITVFNQAGNQVATQTRNIAANNSTEWFLPNAVFNGGVTLPDQFIGSASVTAPAGSQLVGTVTTTNYDVAKQLPTSPPGSGVALGYIMPSRTSGKARISAPTVYKMFGTGTWNSSLVVSNVGTVPVNFSLQFASDSDSPATYNNTISGFSLAPGRSREFYLPNPAHLNNTTIPNNFKGSILVNATSSSGTPQIAGIVQHTNYGRGVATVYLTPGN